MLAYPAGSYYKAETRINLDVNHEREHFLELFGWRIIRVCVPSGRTEEETPCLALSLRVMRAAKIRITSPA